MRLPRDLSGDRLIAGLERLGYEVTRQSGSHVRLTYVQVDGQRHVTVPKHSPLRVGTLNSILSDVASHLKITKEELIERIS